MNFVQHGSVGLRLGCLRDRRRIRCRNVHLDGNQVHERKSDDLRRTVAQHLDGQVPIVRQAWCPQVAKNLEKPPGLAAPLIQTLDEILGACSVVRDRVQIGGAKPAFYGTVGDDGAPFLCTVRKLLRMRQCDLVPPLHGALQNFSGPWHAN